jgi:hypothetical protein
LNKIIWISEVKYSNVGIKFTPEHGNEHHQIQSIDNLAPLLYQDFELASIAFEEETLNVTAIVSSITFLRYLKELTESQRNPRAFEFFSRDLIGEERELVGDKRRRPRFSVTA